MVDLERGIFDHEYQLAEQIFDFDVLASALLRSFSFPRLKERTLAN